MVPYHAGVADPVLVTGASGFLGRRVVALFQAHGFPVIAAGRRAAALPPKTQHFVGDLDSLAQARLNFGIVVHCAALSSSWGRWRDFERANVTGTRRVLEAARRAGAHRLVHLSSPSIYTAPRDRFNIVEADFDPGNRLNNYIRSKIAAEQLLERERTANDPEVVVLRPRGIIGKGDPSIAPRLLRAHARIGIPLFREGTNPTDLTSVHNVANATLLAAQATHTGTYNITNGDPRPFRELAELLLQVRGLKPRFRNLSAGLAYRAGALAEGIAHLTPGQPEPVLTRYHVATLGWAQTLDISRARAELGYEPQTTIEAALSEYRLD